MWRQIVVVSWGAHRPFARHDNGSEGEKRRGRASQRGLSKGGGRVSVILAVSRELHRSNLLRVMELTKLFASTVYHDGTNHVSGIIKVLEGTTFLSLVQNTFGHVLSMPGLSQLILANPQLTLLSIRHSTPMLMPPNSSEGRPCQTKNIACFERLYSRSKPTTIAILHSEP